MAIYHKGKKIISLYHKDKKIESIYHTGIKIFQYYVPAGTVLWSGNTGFTPYNADSEDVSGGNLKVSTTPIEMSDSIEHVENGLIFNFGGNVSVAGGSRIQQGNVSKKIAKSSLSSSNQVVSGSGLWGNYSVYAKMPDSTHVIFTSNEWNTFGPMSTCIGNVNGNNGGSGREGWGYNFSICKSIVAY